MAKPITAKPMTMRSTSLRAFQAATTPIGIARAMVTTSVESVSASVGSRRWAIRRVTARFEKIDTPRSPCARPHTQTANCSTTGRSSPSLTRTASIASAVASSPAMIAAGSPGAKRSRKKTNSATTAIPGTTANRRRMMYEVRGWERATPVALFCPSRSPHERHWSAALPAKSLLHNPPQHRQAGVGHDAAEAVLAIGERRVPLAERDVDHLLHGALLQLL